MTDLSLELAAAALARGGVVVYPTEAVWGIGCDANNRVAVLRLLAIKQRPVDKGVILIAASIEQLDGLIDWAALADERARVVRASWPGPNTWAVPATAAVPA
ncbi:MAG: Sua5/YciO/YrdC/YwlC family protein, partial [Lysobacter sp.]